MDKEEIQAIIALPIILLLAVGIAFAGSQGGVDAFGIPLFALCVGLAIMIQWVAFVPAYLKQTESFYDLMGSITYIVVTVTAVLLSPSMDVRVLLLLVIISVWAIRLGSFLVTTHTC